MSETYGPKRTLSYVPAFDGMRGLFSILIIIGHWRLTQPITPIGWHVLQGFFVLSGFLIVRILIYDRTKHPGFGAYIKAFYKRRTLRIFPLYFIYLGFWGLVRVLFRGSEFIQIQTQELADFWPMYVTYTANLKALVNVEAADSPFFTHLWSLSLEEQFYLFIPFVIFLLRGKWLKRAVILIILVPFVTRIVGQHYLLQYNDDVIWAGVLMLRNLVFQLDAFAFGAVLAIFNLDWIKHPKRWLAILLTIYVGLTVYHYFLLPEYVPLLMEYTHQAYDTTINVDNISLYMFIKILAMPELLPMGNQYIYMMPLINTIFFLLVLTAMRGDSAMKWLFENKLMIKIGKVTYGMYVYHYCLIVIFIKALGIILGRPPSTIHIIWHIPLFLLYFLILYHLSKLSFRYIETPFLRAKRAKKKKAKITA